MNDTLISILCVFEAFTVAGGVAVFCHGVKSLCRKELKGQTNNDR